MRQSSAEIGVSSSWLSTQPFHYLEQAPKPWPKHRVEIEIFQALLKLPQKTYREKGEADSFLYAYLRIEFQCHNALVVFTYPGFIEEGN